MTQRRRAQYGGGHFPSPFTFSRLRSLVSLCAALASAHGAETPPLLAQAVGHWVAGGEDLAFTQHTRFFSDGGKVREERVERYDPSLPDSRRWRLLEVDGRKATDEERKKWETKKNGKARKRVVKAPAEYLDLDHARKAGETPSQTRFEIGLRPAALLHLLAVEDIIVYVAVDNESGRVAHIAATLRQPIRVLLGLARITGLDLDVRLEAVEREAEEASGEVQPGSSARIAMSKFGSPMEYAWSDFKRVMSFGTARKAAK